MAKHQKLMVKAALPVVNYLIDSSLKVGMVFLSYLVH